MSEIPHGVVKSAVRGSLCSVAEQYERTYRVYAEFALRPLTVAEVAEVSVASVQSTRESFGAQIYCHCVSLAPAVHENVTRSPTTPLTVTIPGFGQAGISCTMKLSKYVEVQNWFSPCRMM